jgi:hypothetical protein
MQMWFPAPPNQTRGTLMAERFCLFDKVFLTDNGVTRNVFNKSHPEREHRFNRDIGKRNFLVGREMIKTKAVALALHATPLMLIEVLGIAMDRLNPLPNLDRTVAGLIAKAAANGGARLVEELMDIVRADLRKNPELKHEELCRRFAELKDHRSPSGAMRLDAMFGHSIGDANFHEYVIEICAADRVQAIDLQRYVEDDAVRESIDAAFLSSFRNSLLSKDSEYSHARIVDQLYRRAVRKKGLSWEPPRPYHSVRDAVDAEIVHFAIHGVWRDGAKREVAVFSNECLESWIPRCDRYLGASSLINDWEKERGYPPLELAPGLIFQVDTDTGEIRDECIDVAGRFDLSEYTLTRNAFLKAPAPSPSG